MYAQVRFSSRESRISVNGGSLFIQNPYEVWTGTLEEKNGVLAGSSITFDYGVYRKNNKKAEIKGKMNGAGADYLLQGNEGIFAHPGVLLSPILVLGSGNLLEGAPELVGTTTLLNSFSELQINISNRLGQSILMNDGLITLLNDLTLGDNTLFTGSGRINLNYRTLRFPAKETAWTSQLYFSTPNDIVLSAKTALSGTWTFDGANAVLQGNGNILDLTAGGTLWIKSGTDLELTDIHVRGLGDIYGSIIFEDNTSQIRLSNATLQLASNYSVTQGGIYVEGVNSSIITGTNMLIIATGASMTVDKVTLFADALDVTATVNISPNIPDGLQLIYKNNGILKALGETGNSTLAIDNSNAIVGWIKDTSNVVAGLLVDMSNAIVAGGGNALAIENSNAIVGWIKNTSNITVSTYNLVTQNSDAIVTINELSLANSSAVVFSNSLAIFNSNAIVSLSQGVTNNSNAIVGWIKDTSNAVNNLRPLVVASSNAIVGWIRNTSNVMVSTYNFVRQNSSAILHLQDQVVANSDAIVSWIQDTSNIMVSTYNLVVENSNAIAGWAVDTSNAVAGLMVTISNALVTLSQGITDNSNAIIGWVQETSNVMISTYNLVVENSNAIAQTSNNLVFAHSLAVFNSNAIRALSRGITNNSNAIVGWIRNTSNALINTYNLTVQSSNAILGLSQGITDNSNALVGWVQETSNMMVSTYNLVVENSNAILGLSQGITDNSNALVGWAQDTSNVVNNLRPLVVASSNAIVGWIRNTSNVMVSTYNFVRQNSFAILNLGNRITSNSNAIVGWIQDTSNNLVSTYQLVVDNSTAIVGWVQNTSDTMAGFVVSLSDAIVAGGGNALAVDNSNAIISWIQDTSNVVAGLLVDMSNSIVAGGGNALAVDNSNAIVGWLQDTSNNLVSTYNLVVENSNALVQTSNNLVFAHSLAMFNSNAIIGISHGVANNSNAILGLSHGITNNSNAIVGWIKDTSNVLVSTYQFVVENSWAIMALNDQVGANSWSILNLNERVLANSDAIVAVHNLAIASSNAITGWIQDTSNAAAGLLVDTSYAVVAVLDRVMSPTTRYLLESNVTASVVMDDSLYLKPGHRISIYGDMQIDGSGATIFFCDPLRSQLAIRPGTKLYLRNMTFANLSANSIHIPIDSQLIIEEDVTFYLSQDITFSLGSIVLGAQASNFFVSGYGGIQKLAFSQHPALLLSGLDLGSSSLVLQNIELDGVDSISKSSDFIDGQLIQGGIVCAGNSIVNLYNSNTMNFFIESINNSFCIRTNSIGMRGSIAYGSKLVNQLFIQFSFQNPLAVPYRILFGDNSLYLSSSVGRAHLTFVDFLVQVFNEGANAFVMDINSGLFGQNVRIQNFPIKLLSNQFEIGDSLILSSDQANAIDISFVRSLEELKLFLTRPMLAYEFRRNQLRDVEKNNLNLQ
jgi:hypothetical protein